jgi:outer membrane receptor protein involved in Fe transport
VHWRSSVIAALALIFVGHSALAQPVQSSILSYDAAFFANSRPNTAFDMIGRLPGFTFEEGATARGFAGTAGNVLIDGQRPTSKTDSLQSMLARIPAANVERIELIRGAAPGIDMQGLTVIANVILKKEDSTHVVVTAENLVFTDGHMIPNGSVEFTRHSGASIYEGSIFVIQNYDDSVGHGIHNVFDGAGNLLTHDLAISHGLGVGFGASGAATLPLWGGEFKANVLFRDSPFVDRLSYSRPGFLQLFKDDSRNSNGELGLHWKGPVGPVELETLVLQRLGHNPSTSDSDDGVTAEHFMSLADTGETIARTTVTYLPTDALTLESGGEGAFNFLDGKTAFLINGVNQPLPSANARVEERRGELFGQATWRISDAWLLETEVRAEVSNISESGSVQLSRSFFYPKPRVVLTWSPDKDTQIRLRFERVVGQLDFNNFIASANLSATGVTAGNENLRPDQRTQYAISFERHFWDKGAVVLSYMHEEIKDVVDLIPVTSPAGTFDEPGNIGNGKNDEIKLEATLPLDRLYIPGGLLTTTSIFDLTSVRDPVTGVERVISAQRPQNIRINFSQDIDSLKSTWGIFYYHAWDEHYFRLEQVRHRKVSPPYFQAYWDYKPSPEWTFHLEVDDITSFVYHDDKFNFAGPRNTAPLDNIDEFIAHSNPQIDFRVRWTF